MPKLPRPLGEPERIEDSALLFIPSWFPERQGRAHPISLGWYGGCCLKYTKHIPTSGREIRYEPPPIPQCSRLREVDEMKQPGSLVLITVLETMSKYNFDVSFPGKTSIFKELYQADSKTKGRNCFLSTSSIWSCIAVDTNYPCGCSRFQ